MIYLVFAIIFSSLIFITFKLFDAFNIDNLQAIVTNYVIAGILCILSAGSSWNLTRIIQAPWFGMAIVLGILFIVVFYIFAESAQRSGVALTAVVSKMTVIIPILVGVIFYGEQINVLKIAGILCALLAFSLVLRKEGEKSKLRFALIWLPLILFIGAGFNDTLMKHCEKLYGLKGDEIFLFLSVVFLSTLLIGGTSISWKYLKYRKKIKVKNIYGGIALGLLNVGSTYFMFKSFALFESIVFFPVFNVGVVTISALTGLIAFKERLSLINWIGVIASIASILLIAFGQ